MPYSRKKFVKVAFKGIFSIKYASFTELFWKENWRSKFSAISTLCIENSEEIHFYGKFSSSETFAGNVTTSISICAISKNSCSMLRSSQNANRCSSMSKIRFCQKKCLQLENKSYLTKCCLLYYRPTWAVWNRKFGFGSP